MKGKEKQTTKRRSLITDFVVYLVIYIAIICLGGYYIKEALLLNQKNAELIKKENQKHDMQTQELLDSQEKYASSENNVLEKEKEIADLKTKLSNLKKGNKESVAEIEELNNEIKTNNDRKNELNVKLEEIKSDYEKVNNEYISVNNKYQESIKNK